MASANAAAAHIFIGIARFRELTEQGVITKQPKGQYDLTTVRREAFAGLRAERGGHGTAALSSERAALAREQTLTAQIKNAAARGDLVSLAEFGKRVDAMLAVFRERILSIPGKNADPLSMRTREEIEPMLRAELTEALDELSNPASFGDSGDRRAASASLPDRPTPA
jgi:phage terminase Nu1 subunit (DNA packaging protein)